MFMYKGAFDANPDKLHACAPLGILCACVKHFVSGYYWGKVLYKYAILSYNHNFSKITVKWLLKLCYRVGGEDVRLMLWDTAGQEEFDAITKAYYRGEKIML